MGPSGGPSGHALEIHSLQGLEVNRLGPGCKDGPVRAEWGWGGVGHALG